MLSGRFLFYFKKRKISRNGHLLSLVFIRCHSLSVVVPLVIFRCHLLPFVVIRCTTRCHSFSLDVPLVCLFTNDPLYPSDERNKLFSFQIKPTLKVTTLGIRMCFTELLLWKNQKGSTGYHMTLFEWDSTADIFFEIFNDFWTSYFKKKLQTTNCKGFHLHRMPNDYCFRVILEKWDLGP